MESSPNSLRKSTLVGLDGTRWQRWGIQWIGLAVAAASPEEHGAGHGFEQELLCMLAPKVKLLFPKFNHRGVLSESFLGVVTLCIVFPPQSHVCEQSKVCSL